MSKISEKDDIKVCNRSPEVICKDMIKPLKSQNEENSKLPAAYRTGKENYEEEVMAIEQNNFIEQNIKIVVEESHKMVLREISNDFYCVTFASPTFADERNKEYLNSKKISMGIYNIIHQLDPIPSIFFVGLVVSILLPL